MRSGAAIARMRARAQRLHDPVSRGPADVVRTMLAVQSQEFAVARWSVGQRGNGIADADVVRAFDAGEILRTHVLRPTWHFVGPEDIGWLLILTAPRVLRQAAYGHRQCGLEAETFVRAEGVIAKELADGQPLTRAELGQRLQAEGLPSSGVCLGHVMGHAELVGLVCSGPMRGKQHTYTLLEERAPNARTMDRDHAVAELVERYFVTRGPATVKDLMWWSSLTGADIRTGIEAAGDALRSETIDGRPYWRAADASPSRTTTRVDLIQVYDELAVSYQESRDALGAPAFVDRIPSAPVHGVLLGGQFVGRWRPVPDATGVVIETLLHRPLHAAETQALDREIARYGRFLGVPATRR
jgi:hypothetical protein